MVFLTGRAALVALAGVVAGPASGVLAAPGGERVALPSPVPTWPHTFQDDGPTGAGFSIPIRVYLKGSHPAAELKFATAASTPGAAGDGRYLTPGQFTARFGATSAEAAAVTAWGKAAGLQVTGQTAHYIAMTGPAPQVSSALGTSIHAYSEDLGVHTITGGYAPVEGMSVPAAIGGDVSTVTGLDGFESLDAAQAAHAVTAAPAGRAGGGAQAARALPSQAAAQPGTAYRCSAWWGQHVSQIPEAYGQTSAPNAVCGYSPQQMRSAYGVQAGDGRGATIAIVLDGNLPTMEADADRFFSAHHIRGFAPGQFTINADPGMADSCFGASDTPEEPLDVETAHTIAPAAKVVYVAADCTGSNNQTGLLDAETRIVDQHLADVSTESYSLDESGQFTPASAMPWTQILEQGAVEGIGFTFDSGDGGDATGADVTFPASDPWATAAGGTSLEIGKAGTVTGELGWGENGAEEDASGTGYQQPPPGDFISGSTGGRSVFFSQPAYQRAAVPMALATNDGTQPAARVTPDVSADADVTTGWQIGYTDPDLGYIAEINGGTSGASPIVASLEADAKRPAGHAIGFANPLLYDMGTMAGIRDVTTPAAPVVTLAPDCDNDQVVPNPACLITLGPDTSLTETPGYDDVTGLGGVTDKFITALSTYQP